MAVHEMGSNRWRFSFRSSRSADTLVGMELDHHDDAFPRACVFRWPLNV